MRDQSRERSERSSVRFGSERSGTLTEARSLIPRDGRMPLKFREIVEALREPPVTVLAAFALLMFGLAIFAAIRL